MANRTRKTMGRSEISDTGRGIEKRMGEYEKALDTLSRDVSTIRKTLDSLTRIGTAEGVDSTDRFIHGARDITTRHFDDEDRELDRTQRESSDREHDLDRRSEGGEADRERIKDAGSQVDTRDAQADLTKAEQEAIRDIEFLKQQLTKAEEARERSEEMQRQYGQVVRSGQGGGR